MPKRKIPKSYRNVTGVLSSRKNERMIASESTLERDLYILLDFDPVVLSFEEQPEIIPYNLLTGQPSRYTPDCLINFNPKPNVVWQYSPFRLFTSTRTSTANFNRAANKMGDLATLIPQKPRRLPASLLIEVKYRQELIDKWTELKPKFKAARAFAAARNWEFRILTEKEIRTPVLDNVKFMRPFKRHDFASEEMMKVLNRLAELKTCKPTELLNSLTENPVEQGHLLPILWHLVARNEIGVDWSKPINMRSSLESFMQ